MLSQEIKNEVIRLRKEKRLSIDSIRKELKISKGTVSSLLKNYPLSDEELKERMKISGTKRKPQVDLVENSKYLNLCPNFEKLSTNEKAKIAESAILFRLSLLCLSVYGSSFDGDKSDWIIQLDDGSLKSIQVRWANRSKNSSPTFSLKKSAGRKKSKRFEKGDFDYFIGYDLFSDTAFVYTWGELEHLKTTVSASKESLEAWNKILC